MSVCSVLFVVLSNVLTNCFSRRGQSVVCLCFSENSFYLRSVQALAFLLWYFKYVRMHALKKKLELKLTSISLSPLTPLSDVVFKQYAFKKCKVWWFPEHSRMCTSKL